MLSVIWDGKSAGAAVVASAATDGHDCLCQGLCIVQQSASGSGCGRKDVYKRQHALELAEKNGYTFIHPFDDLAVATGQGTIAMEIFKELPLVEYILVPIGGGGLATGVSTLAKLLNPKIKVIGVEPVSYTHLKAAMNEN